MKQGTVVPTVIGISVYFCSLLKVCHFDCFLPHAVSYLIAEQKAED